MALTWHEIFTKIEKQAVSLINQLTPDPYEQCSAAFEDLGHVVRLTKSMTVDDISNVPEFTAGIQAVIRRLDAFRAVSRELTTRKTAWQRPPQLPLM